MNKKILASMMVVGLLALALGYGTHSYFSGVEEGSGSFSTGTLTLDTVSYSGWTLPNLSPGQEWTTQIELKNTGSLDAMYVYMAFYITSDSGPGNGLADKIVLEEIKEWCYLKSWTTTTFDASTSNVWLGVWSGTQDNSISLYDLATVALTGGESSKTSMKLHTGNPPTSGPYLPSTRSCIINLKFKLLGDTNNNYQGKTCSFTIKFIASDQTGTTLDGSI